VTPTTSDLHYARRLRDYLRLGVSARPAACLRVLAGHDIGVTISERAWWPSGGAPKRSRHPGRLGVRPPHRLGWPPYRLVNEF
jgi:hypothetical protein